MTSEYFFEKDYNKDLWRWIKIYEPIKNHCISYPNDVLLDNIQNTILATQDAGLAYFFTEYFNYKTHLMQKVILNVKSPKYAFAFANHFPKADIKALQDIVINSNNIKYICYFGLFIRNSNVKKIEKIIIQANKQDKNRYAKYAYMWLKGNKIHDLEEFKKIILSSKKPQFLFELAKCLTNPKDISKIERLIIKSGSLTYMRMFAATIDGANVPKLEKVVLASQNMKEIKKFAKAVKNSTLKNFQILF